MARKASSTDSPVVENPSEDPTTDPGTTDLGTEVVKVADPRDLLAAELGAEVAPMIVSLFSATEQTTLSGNQVGRMILRLIREYPDPESGKPQWNRSKQSPEYLDHERDWYLNAIETMRTPAMIESGTSFLPAENDFPRAKDREAILENLARTKNNVAVALNGRTGGKGLIQEAIVDYCMTIIDPALTTAEIVARRTVDQAGLYFNHATLPTRLLTAIKAEYVRCGLKLPANLGGKAETGNGSNSPGPKGVTVTLTDLSTVTVGARSGSIAVPAVAESLRTLAAAFAGRVQDLAKASWEGLGADDRATAAATVKDAHDLLYVAGKALHSGDVNADDWAKVNHLIPDATPITPTDGVETGAEQESEATT